MIRLYIPKIQIPLFLLVLVYILTMVVTPFTISPVYSDDVDQLEEQIEETQEEKDAKEDFLNGIQAEIDAIANSNQSIYAKIKALQTELDDVQKELNGSEDRVNEAQELVAEKEEELILKQQQYKTLLIESYKRSKISLMDVLLSKDNGHDLYRAYSLHKIVAEKQSGLVGDISQELVDIQMEKEDLEDELGLIQAKMQGMDEAMAALKNEQARIQQELVAQAALEVAIKKDISKLNSQLDNLSGELKAAIDAKVGSGGDSTGGGDYGGGTSPQPPSGNTGQYDIYVAGNKVKDNASGPIRIVPAVDNHVYRVNGSLLYRGVLEMRADTNMYLINELAFEKYLYGLGEVPSSWPAETLKTQAIAGRTYAAKNWSKRSNYGYNLRDDVYDQNYVGYSKEAASYGSSWVGAVNSTTSKVVKSGNDLVATYYHASCGGHTLASEEVWVSALPYTRAESDWTSNRDTYGDLTSYGNASPYSKKKWCGSYSQSCTSADTINDTQMMDLANATIYLTMYPSKQNNILPPASGGMSAAELESALGSNSIQSRVGTLSNVQSVYNNGTTTIESSSRKTSSLRITGSTGSHDIDGANFWTVFNSRSPGSQHIYYSNLWTVNKVSGSWNFYTRGYGHRVGMCQYGAYGRANAGQSHEQILTHYYRGTSIGSYTAPGNIRIGITRVATGDISISSESGSANAIYADGVLVDTALGSELVRVVRQ